MSESRPKVQMDLSIKSWDSRGSLFFEALSKNKITIEKFRNSFLKKAPYEAVMAIIEKNKNVLGFKNFSFDILSGDKFKNILDKKDDSVCYVAKQKFTNNVIGFVVCGSCLNEDGVRVGAIEALGVDQGFSYGHAKADGPRNVGSSLLLVACNELYSKPEHLVQDIFLTASDDKSLEFYKKYGFATSPQADEEGDLTASKSDYPKLETDILSRAGKATIKLHLPEEKEKAASTKDEASTPSIPRAGHHP